MYTHKCIKVKYSQAKVYLSTNKVLGQETP